jgi:hypothetical protein
MIGKYFRKTEGGSGGEVEEGFGLEGEGEGDRNGEGRLRFVKSFETEAEYPDS